MISFKKFLYESVNHLPGLHADDTPEFTPDGEQNPNYTTEHDTQNKLRGVNDYIPFGQNLTQGHVTEDYIHSVPGVILESVEDHPTNSKRLVFRSGPQSSAGSNAPGLVVPKHMWKNSVGPKNRTILGMQARNEMRAKVYGSENRAPLSRGAMEKLHKETLDDHFSKPENEQIKAEKAAIERLHAAGHLTNRKSTLSPGEKTDTVRHEHDEQGRSFEAMSSKGVAGHALYTSGHGENERHYILNTCPGQSEGCGGGVDAHNLHDTSRGNCFAPKAEHQYAGASISRACHEQAKHDPAMSRDWILAHTHSLRKFAEKNDAENKRTLFRPNVVDETDTSSRHVLKHLNKQRAKKNLPPIVANSYGKTNEDHDPTNHYHVTYSNIGPKVKNGAEIPENKRRDSMRIAQTINATDRSGADNVNDEGKKTPPKGSYALINAKRGSDMAKKFERHVTHVKYWSVGRPENSLSEKEKAEGREGHFDANGKPTTPDKAHYGHVTIHGEDGVHRRYDYQKQHILHPRMVSVGKNKKTGKDILIPTDSRFKDEEFLPKNRFKSKNGKKAGHILMTTPTKSTTNDQHHNSFTHHVDDDTISHAIHHNGEYEIDKPEDQEKARGKTFVAPKTSDDSKIKKRKATKAKEKATASVVKSVVNKPKTEPESETSEQPKPVRSHPSVMPVIRHVKKT